MSKAQVDDLYIALEQTVNDGNQRLLIGESIILDGMYADISTLCELIVALPLEERLTYAPKLRILLANLTLLGEGLAKNNIELVDELKELSKIKSASVAYKTADSRDNFGKRDEEE